MNNNNVRTLREATRALQSHFVGPKIPLTLPAESRRNLRHFVEELDGAPLDREDAARADEELKLFWDRHVGGTTGKLGAFVGVLRELRPVLVEQEDLLEWYHLAVKPVISGVGFKKTAVEDAEAFLASVMIYDADEADIKPRARTSHRICNDLVGVYIARTRPPAGDDFHFDAPDNHQVAKQIESVLVTFGKKMPRNLFHLLDDLVVGEATRLQGLTLLSSFLQHQAPHLYSVIHTPLIDSLLKCLMNDTSTTILAVALTSLIMLLPHIPSSLNSRLPRLFLIYSRLLCWEKFSPLSSAEQRSLVTDDRVSSKDVDDGDVGIDPTWEKARPPNASFEASTPELTTYFTYLYGMYPLNLTSYIRKPRRYLRNLDFPGAEDFDLDQAVIRARSEQFRHLHLLHPNFYNMTVDEELLDPKWPKMDPADVVAECHSLAIHSKLSSLVSPGPPPTAKLPDLPPLPPLPPGTHHGAASPAVSSVSLRSGASWRDTVSTAVDVESPILKASDSRDELLKPGSALSRSAGTSPLVDEFPLPAGGFPVIQSTKDMREPRDNRDYLQQRLTGLQNELNFERWHKAQYAQHIGQLMRKNVKDATVEAETLNLINANRALKQQLEQVRTAREATIKDSNLTRKQANNVEANMSERVNKMKREQETWAAEAEELKRLRSEMQRYRDLLSSSESRELNKSHQLEIMKRDLEQLKKLQTQLEDARRKVREFEHRQFDFEQARRELEIVQSEKDTMQMRLQRQEQDRERAKRVHAERVSELEAALGSSVSLDRPPVSSSSASGSPTQRELADAQTKLAQLKKVHSRLLERYTDLEMEYQSVKNQLEVLQGYGRPGRSHSIATMSEITPHAELANDTFDLRSGVLESEYGVESEFGAPSAIVRSGIGPSESASNRYDPRRSVPLASMVEPRRQSTSYSGAAHSWKSPSTSHSRKTNDSAEPSGYNATAPLRPDERSVASANSSEERRKITPNSDVRVYGRGGAQNIKLKHKDDAPKKDSHKKGGLKALKGIAGL